MKLNPKYIALIIVIILLCFLSWCHGKNSAKTVEVPETPKHDSIYKSEHKENIIIQATLKELNLLKLKNDSLTKLKPKIVYRVRTVYDSLIVADTSCMGSLITLYNSFGDLNNLNDSIISGSKKRHEKDSILIASGNNKIKVKQDRITIDSTYIETNKDFAKAEFKRGKKVGRKQGFVGGLILSGAFIVGVKSAIP